MGILESEGVRHLSSDHLLVLDLEGVRFVDGEGARLLRRWRAVGVVLQNPSSFKRELLREERLEDHHSGGTHLRRTVPPAQRHVPDGDSASSQRHLELG